MAKKVYETNWASTEEISDVLKLLGDHAIPHYETPKGIFGLSLGAIWVTQDSDYEKARRLIEDYDRSRAQRVREKYAATREGTGFVATLSNIRKLFVDRPYETLLYALIIVALIAIHWLFYKTIST